MSSKTSVPASSKNDTLAFALLLSVIQQALPKVALQRRVVSMLSREWALRLSLRQQMILTHDLEQLKPCLEEMLTGAQHLSSAVKAALSYAERCQEVIASQSPSKERSNRSRKSSTKKVSPTSQIASNTSHSSSMEALRNGLVHNLDRAPGAKGRVLARQGGLKHA